MKRTISDYARSFAENLDARKAYMWAAAGLSVAAGMLALNYLTTKEPEASLSEQATYAEKVGMLWENVVSTGIPITQKDYLFSSSVPFFKYLYTESTIEFEKDYKTEDLGNVMVSADSIVDGSKHLGVKMGNEEFHMFLDCWHNEKGDVSLVVGRGWEKRIPFESSQHAKDVIDELVGELEK